MSANAGRQEFKFFPLLPHLRSEENSTRFIATVEFYLLCLLGAQRGQAIFYSKAYFWLRI